MTKNKPYLIRAMHEWISDNDCTPYLYINTQAPDVQVPPYLQEDNPLILSASHNACKSLELSNEAVSFQARFSGEIHNVYLPIASIIAVVARENGQGMTFELGEQTAAEALDESVDIPVKSDDDIESSPRKGGLKIIR